MPSSSEDESTTVVHIHSTIFLTKVETVTKQRSSTATSSTPSPTLTSLGKPGTTNLGPLTTTFTPPSSCKNLRSVYSDNVSGDKKSASQDVFVYGVTCVSPNDQYFTHDTACFPEGYAAAYDNLASTTVYPIYFPASICPDGYDTACAISKPVHSTTRTDYHSEVYPFISSLLEPGQVAVGCCPRNLLCDIAVPFQCTKLIVRSDVFPVHKAHNTCGKEDAATSSYSFNTNVQAAITAPAVVLIQPWTEPLHSGTSDAPLYPMATKSSSATTLSQHSTGYMGLITLLTTLFVSTRLR